MRFLWDTMFLAYAKRHSNINLTLSRYTHTLVGRETQAVESLPDLSLPSSQSQQTVKTGTDDLALYLASEAGQHCDKLDDIGQGNRNDDVEKPKLASARSSAG